MFITNGSIWMDNETKYIVKFNFNGSLFKISQVQTKIHALKIA